MRYRVQAYWREGPTAPERIGQQLAGFLTALEWADARLGGFCFVTAEGERHAADTGEGCGRATREAAHRWRFGREDRVCYQPRFFSDRAQLVVTAGVEPVALASLFAPNRLELLVAAELGTRDVLEKALRAAAGAFRADFGHAGTLRFPSPAEPLLSDGMPVAGWLTYLSAAHALPTLPHPAATLPVSELGTIIVAHPDLFADDDERHRASLSALQQALAGS